MLSYEAEILTLFHHAVWIFSIAKVENENLVSSWQGDSKKWITTHHPKLLTQSLILRSKKLEETTGLTIGTIEAYLNTPTAILYKGEHFKAKVWVQDVWTILADEPYDYFALPGDSGSLVVTEDEENVVGMIFAARDNYAIMIPIERILSCFGGISLISEHGI